MKYSDKKNRQRLYLYTHISYISYTYPIHITLVVPSRQCLFTYYFHLLTQTNYDDNPALLQAQTCHRFLARILTQYPCLRWVCDAISCHILFYTHPEYATCRWVKCQQSRLKYGFKICWNIGSDNRINDFRCQQTSNMALCSQTRL